MGMERVHISIRDDQKERVDDSEGFNLSGFVRERLDEREWDE